MPSSSSTRTKSAPTKARPKAAPKAAAKKGVSKASAFKKNKAQELELPSGEVCLARRPGMEQMLAQGVFSDNLMPLIQKSIESAKGNRPTANPLTEAAILQDPKLLADVMTAYDKVLPMVVMEPTVRYHRREVDDGQGNTTWVTIPESERDDEIVYSDDVDMLDKVFIFQWASGGSPDLATFRQQLSEGVAALADVEVV